MRTSMKAFFIEELSDLGRNRQPLKLKSCPRPSPKDGEILIRLSVCGICHTELDEIEGRTLPPTLPVIPGHQAIGRVVERGPGSNSLPVGTRVGVAWIWSACGRCEYCRAGNENLCPDFRATGRDADGGYAEYMVVPEAFAHRIPETLTDLHAAPLLCAGAVGYRSLRLTGLKNGQTLGLTGFGASGHLVLKAARSLYPGSRILVFARNLSERAFALQLGATWAGDTADSPPESCDAVIDTTPAWRPLLQSLTHLKKGGRLVINAIRKETGDRESILELDYAAHLWHEKEVKTVANVTRADVRDFLALAAGTQLIPEVEEYPFEEANRALLDIRERRIRGAKVLRIA